MKVQIHHRQPDIASPPQTVTIGRRIVGRDEPPFIVAEAGVNHDGSVARAIELIDAAADAGADAVKFQAFTAAALTTASAATAAYQTRSAPASSQQAMLAGLELSTDDFKRIADHCGGRGICFLATPFSPIDVDRLVEVGTVAIKIASTDIVDFRLLKRACETQLPIILSTGAADEPEIAQAVERIRSYDAGRRLILLHCVSCYPTPFDRANLAAIASLRGRFDSIVGYSDHTVEIDTGALAVAAGACVLETHITLDRNAPGPDHAVSLEPGDMADYVRRAKRARLAMGDGDLRCQPIEHEVRNVARKHVVAARDINVGDTLSADALVEKRAATGLPVCDLQRVIGKTALVTIDEDTPISADMIE